MSKPAQLVPIRERTVVVLPIIFQEHPAALSDLTDSIKRELNRPKKP